MKSKRLMKILSAILSVIMVLSAVSLSVFASDEVSSEGKIYDISEAEAKIEIVLSEMNVKKDDVITVTVELTTNFPTGNVQLPVIFDKTQFGIVGTVTDGSYYTVAEDSSFAGKNYAFGGRADRTNGFSSTSAPEKWNTEEAMAQYGYAFITATYNPTIGNDDDTLAIPQGEAFVTFSLKALTDVSDARESVFISPDWTKTEANKKGLMTIGFSDAVDNTNPLTYIAYGVSYEFETVYHDYQPTVTAPTCTEDGFTTYTCTICGDSYVEDIVPAHGHTEGEWVVTKEAEVGVAGEEILYCAVCGEAIDAREIPAIDAYFKAAEGTTTVVDKENGIIYGLEEGLYDLEGYVEYEGGTVEYVESENGFGTGTVVNFVVNGEIYESYTVVIFGDLTGDGVIDTYDAAFLAAVVNFDIKVEKGSAVALAADIMFNDDVADTFDLFILYAVVNGDTTISQTPELV